MVTLRKIEEFSDGTANYNFNTDEAFVKYYINQTGQPVTDKGLAEFIKNMIFEAVGETYTKDGADFVNFGGK